MNEDEAKLLQMTANADQAVAGLKHFATTHGTYFRALLREGFTAGQAMHLVLDYQQTTLRAALGQGYGDDAR